MIASVIRAGRAVLYPIYKGSYERHVENDQGSFRDRLIMRERDLRRSLDYLESRDDIDSSRLAFYGHSLGVLVNPYALALDNRFQAAILLNGGLTPRWPGDQIDPLHFWPRVRIPALMLNGRRDNVFPHEESQVPLFQLLGTPEADKRHVVYERGHAHATLSDEEIAEVLGWLDKYLGPVRQVANP